MKQAILMFSIIVLFLSACGSTSTQDSLEKTDDSISDNEAMEAEENTEDVENADEEVPLILKEQYTYNDSSNNHCSRNRQDRRRVLQFYFC